MRRDLVPRVCIGAGDLVRRFPLKVSGVLPYIPLQVTYAEAIFGKRLASKLKDNPLTGIDRIQPMTDPAEDIFTFEPIDPPVGEYRSG
jgi:hypothetical protein